MVEAVLSPSKLETYARTARARAQARRKQLEARREQAWQVARRAADVLREQYGATKVVVFGSLRHPFLFHKRSDIDLAAWGIHERDYYRAVGTLLGLDVKFEVDLIEAEFARPALEALIEREGIAL